MGAAREARTSKASPLVLEWAKTLTNQNAWPEGKSVEGFEKWLRSNFYKAQKESKDLSKLLGIPHDAGHASQGANTLSNLAPQLRFGPDGNRDLVDRTTGEQISRALDHVRLRKDLMDVDADFYLSQAFESYLNKGTIDPKTQLNLADFSAKYRQMILHDRSYPTAAAAEAHAQLLRLEEAFREQEGWLDGNPVIEDFRIGTAETESGPVTTYNDPDVKNPPSVNVEYDYTTPEGKRIRAKEQRPQFASGIIPEKGVLKRNNGFVSFAKAAGKVTDEVPFAGELITAGLVGGAALLSTGDPAFAAETVKDSVPEMLPIIGDISADDQSANIQKIQIDGQDVFVDMNRNMIMDDVEYGVQRSGDSWTKVKRGEGAAGPGLTEKLGKAASDLMLNTVNTITSGL